MFHDYLKTADMRNFYVRDENCGLSAHQFLQNISNMLLKNTSSRNFQKNKVLLTGTLLIAALTGEYCHNPLYFLQTDIRQRLERKEENDEKNDSTDFKFEYVIDAFRMRIRKQQYFNDPFFNSIVRISEEFVSIIYQ